ncbi:MAG: ATP-grasp domain-containing protein [Candidatus Sumerlaeota bacterium]|nr:ATP-grasp domain-containing protein [Candidatus Sumerlaeota bacterium]
MNKPTILILAASLYQLPAIRRALELGYRVITLDNRPSNPGHAFADRSYNASTTDLEAVLSVARENNVNGVLAVCTDVSLPAAAYVAEKMNLAGPPYEATRVLCDKNVFRRWQQAQGYRHPEAFPVRQDGPDPDGFFESGWGVVKPARSSGSKGVFIVRSQEEFIRRLPESLEFSPNGECVLERYIEGRQGTCEGVLCNGQIAFACLTDRVTAPVPYVATHGHRIPSRMNPKARLHTLEAIASVFNRLGVHQGLFDCDFVVTDDDAVFILEMTPRLGGNSLSALLRLSSGFDAVDFAVRYAILGQAPVPPADLKFRPAAVALLGTVGAGRLQYDTNAADALRKAPWVASLVIEKQIGDATSPFINGTARVGEMLITGQDRDDLDAKVAESLIQLNLRAVQ